jgi:hypothetical protein
MDAGWLADVPARVADDDPPDAVGCCEHAVPAHRVNRMATAGEATRMTMVSRRD